MSKLLALDPGETIGWCRFEDRTPVAWGQLGWRDLDDFQALFAPLVAADDDRVVVERFALYRHKAATQINSEMVPAQVIGMAIVFAHWRGVPIQAQPAAMIHDDGEITPPLRRLVDPYISRVSVDRHARDAMAHGFAYLRPRAVPRVARPRRTAAAA